MKKGGSNNNKQKSLRGMLAEVVAHTQCTTTDKTVGLETTQSLFTGISKATGLIRCIQCSHVQHQAETLIASLLVPHSAFCLHVEIQADGFCMIVTELANCTLRTVATTALEVQVD